jgi:DNA-binding transcriptional ArsR family regulator
MKTLDIKKRILQKRIKRKNSEPMEIRDAREKEFFIIDDAYLNGFAKVCGIQATATYMALCRHVGKDQTCFPSIDLMASRLGMSKRSVVHGLKELEEHRIIKVSRLKGSPNIYTLLNKRNWRKFLSMPHTEPLIEGKEMGINNKACMGCPDFGGGDSCVWCVAGSRNSYLGING